MKRIPLTQSVVISGSERQEIAEDFAAAAKVLEESAALNFTLLQDWMASEAKVKEYANLIVSQSESCQQIMQINGILADALAAIRAGGDVEETLEAMTARLTEFDSGS